MTFLRASEGSRPSRLRRLTIAAVSGLVFSALFSASLSPTAAHARPPRKKVRAAVIRVETARLRSGPGTHHKPSALLDSGRKARVIGRKQGWVQLQLASGTKGWVRADLVKVNKKATRVAAAASPSSGRKKRVAASREESRSRRSSQGARTSRSSQASRWSRSSSNSRTLVASRSRSVSRTARPAPRRAVPKMTVRPLPVAATRRVRAVTPPAGARLPFLRAAAIRTGVKSPAVAAAAKKAKASAVAPKPSEEIIVAAALPEETDRDTRTAAAPATEDELPLNPTPVETPVVSVEAVTVTPSAPLAATTPSAAASAGTGVKLDPRVEGMIRSAYSYRGTPYRFGATGRGAFDCSSFIMHLMKQQGRGMPRTASEQYHKGIPVEKHQMMRGDLVFFKNTYKRGISHVGLYIGDGKFIHASSRGGVRVDNLSGAYYVNHWAGARRPR